MKKSKMCRNNSFQLEIQSSTLRTAKMTKSKLTTVLLYLYFSRLASTFVSMGTTVKPGFVRAEGRVEKGTHFFATHGSIDAICLHALA